MNEFLWNIPKNFDKTIPLKFLFPWHDNIQIRITTLLAFIEATASQRQKNVCLYNYSEKKERIYLFLYVCIVRDRFEELKN